MDFILGGQPQGDVANTLLQNNFDPSALRPYLGADGRSYITSNAGGKAQALVTNTPATLRKDEWKTLDMAVVKSAQQRLKFAADLRARNLTYSIAGGMGKTVLETEVQSDIDGASTSMDGLDASRRDRPQYNLTNLPLPITHKDFSFSARQLAASRQGGSPLDTSMAELSGRKVAEKIEELHLGVGGDFAFGGGSLYGLANYPSRNLKALTSPTTSNQATVVAEVLAMRQQSYDDRMYGPWVLYHSLAYDQFMDTDYSSAKGDNTLRDRIKKIEGIEDVRSLDFLSGSTYQMLLVQMTTDVVRSVIGMDVTTLQWPSHGGLELNFKVMAIIVPQVRADYSGRCGIVHGTVA